MFAKVSGTWRQQATLAASDPQPDDQFGSGLTLAGDVLVVGAPEHSVAGQYRGAAYVYTRSGQSWQQAARLVTADGASDDRFGERTAVEGGTVVIGCGFCDLPGGVDQGAAYVFTVESGWQQQAKLIVPGAPSQLHAGLDSKISGNVVILGAQSQPNGSIQNQGALHFFARTGTTWNYEAQLLPDPSADPQYFGYRMAFADRMLLVAAMQRGAPSATDGLLYLYTGAGTSWQLAAPAIRVPRRTENDNWSPQPALSNRSIAATAEYDTMPPPFGNFEGRVWLYPVAEVLHGIFRDGLEDPEL